MKTLFILTSTAIFLSSVGFSQSKVQDCTKLWELEKEAGCPAAPSAYGLQAPNFPSKDYFVEKKMFGPTKCVTDDDVDSAVETLETKCDQWTDKKRDELRMSNRHITGVCNHECSPCPKNEILQKCKVTGEVQYRISSDEPN